MAQSTAKTFLYYKEESANTYTKLVDIKTFPDMGAAPQTIEVTTLSDDVQQFINGIGASAAMEFTANYDAAAYEDLLALKDKSGTEFALYFGENGTNGKFLWEGQLSVWVIGGGVNGIVEMKISIIPGTAISKAE